MTVAYTSRRSTGRCFFPVQAEFVLDTRRGLNPSSTNGWLWLHESDGYVKFTRNGSRQTGQPVIPGALCYRRRL